MQACCRRPRGRGCRTRVEQLHWEAQTQQLLVLSSGLHLAEHTRSAITALDVTTRAESARVEEFLETYGFCAFAPLQQGPSPPLYVAGAVYAGGGPHQVLFPECGRGCWGGLVSTMDRAGALPMLGRLASVPLRPCSRASLPSCAWLALRLHEASCHAAGLVSKRLEKLDRQSRVGMLSFLQ